jgi:hypothetical protein
MPEYLLKKNNSEIYQNGACVYLSHQQIDRLLARRFKDEKTDKNRPRGSWAGGNLHFDQKRWVTSFEEEEYRLPT